jgi:hypothetical protein
VKKHKLIKFRLDYDSAEIPEWTIDSRFYDEINWYPFGREDKLVEILSYELRYKLLDSICDNFTDF